MKYIITERQYRILNEETEEILELPFKMFNNDRNFLQEYLEMIGNPPYKIIGNLDLRGVDVVTLGNLVGVEGYLDLRYTNITSLGNLQFVEGFLDLDYTNITSLGNLKYVGGNLDLRRVQIESLGNLQSVGGYLDLNSSEVKSLGNIQYIGGALSIVNTPLSETTTKEEIRNIPNLTIGGNIYL